MSKKATPFLYLGFLSAFSLLAFDLYQPALPAMTNYFKTTHAIGQLTLSLYLFSFGISQLFWGPLIDHFGRQRCLPASLILFLLATFGCIFALNIEMLIVSRIVQGFAVCCANMIAFSSSRDYEDSTERAKILSQISMIVSVSPIFAPLLGSIVFHYYGWQSTFVLMGIISLILLVFSYLILRESPYWCKSEVPFLLYTSLKTYRELLKHRRLWVGTIIITAAFSAVMISVVNAAYLIIDTLKISPLLFSLLFACNGFIIIIGNFLGIQLRKRFSLKKNIRLGGVVMIAGALLMLLIYLIQGFTLLSLTPVLLTNLGVSLINPPTLSLTMADYEQKAATATAIINTTRMSVSAIIASITGGVIAYNAGFLGVGLLFCALVALVASQFIDDFGDH